MYLDSGIIVKLLVREADSLFFNQTLAGRALNSSELCLTEVHSSLLSKERAGQISRTHRQIASGRFSDLIEDEVLKLLPLDRRVLERANAILSACQPVVPLRTLDALHVATCDLYRCEALCATDGRMRQAGAQLALKIFPESLEEIKS
jgi:predicted nucleic acid-binding protein